MANPEHLAILKSGVDNWNRWRTELQSGRYPSPDLSGADLSGANLKRANMTAWVDRVEVKVNLSGSSLREAHATEADFKGADLRGANLHGAFLAGCNFL